MERRLLLMVADSNYTMKKKIIMTKGKQSLPSFRKNELKKQEFQVTPKVSHLHAVKRIFRYLKGQPKLGLWYPKNSPFDLEAYTDSDYVGASLDRKSTTGGCQFLRRRLISWHCKKQTIVANSTTEAEDSNEKKPIQMIKIHTDHNVVDLLTKAFDVGRFQYLIASIRMLNS
ncbi:hypothetical protein Tco_0264837 [Tanacetum coccineum]